MVSIFKKVPLPIFSVLFTISFFWSCGNDEKFRTDEEVELLINSLLDSSRVTSIKKRKIEILEEASRLSEENNLSVLELKSKSSLLNVHHLIGDLDYLIEHSEEVANLAKKLNDPLLESAAYRYFGHAHHRLGLMDEARENFSEALRIIAKIKDQDQKFYIKGLVLTSLKTTFTDRERQEQLREESIESMMMVSENYPQYKTARSLALNSKALLYMDRNQLDSAEIYFKKTLAVFDGDSVAVDMMTYPTETLGIVYTMRDNYKEAIRWFDEALRISIELNKKQGIVDLYNRKHDAFSKLGIQDSSQYYLNKYAVLNDSLKNVEKSTIPKVVKKLKAVQENNITKLNIWVWVLIMGVLLFLFIVFILWNKYLKSKILHSAKDKQLSNKLLRIKKLSEEIEQKSKLNIEDLIQLATESKPAFLTAFQEYFPDFDTSLSNLAQPNKLVATEMEVCAFMKLSFDTKEIARYTNSSVRSIESRKYRIRKKLGLSGEEDFNLWMSKI